MPRLYFRQWLSGSAYATSDPVAAQMVNYAYALGDADTGEAVLVDPAYDVEGLIGLLGADGMHCVGAIATHYHADHVGGSLAGYRIDGIAALLEHVNVPVHVHADEAPWITRTTGVDGELVHHDAGDVLTVGAIPIELLHTPGHTPGSQCLLVDGHLVTGDTLFLDGCGRTDLPGSDPAAMYETLTKRLAGIPGETIVCPGHHYSPEPSLTMREVRAATRCSRPARRTSGSPRSHDDRRWRAT